MAHSESLVEKRSALLAEADALVAAAKTEERDLTVEDETKIDAALSEVRNLDAQIARHKELEARSAEAAELRSVNNIAPAITTVKSEARTYAAASSNSFMVDAFNAQFRGDASASERLARHMTEERVERRDVTSANFAGLVVPQFLIDLAAPFARAGRPVADSARKHQLPDAGLTLSISKVTTGSSVDTQSEGASVSETNMDDTKLDISVVTIAGQQTVSRQALERGSGVDMIVMGDLVNAYHTKLDANLVAELLSSAGQSVTYTDASPTVAELYPKLADAIQKVQTTFFAGPNAVIMHPRRLAFFLAALDTTNRPLVVPAQRSQNGVGAGNGAPVYGNSGYEIMGLPIITDANVSTAQGSGTNEDTIFIGNLQELHLWEQGSGEPMYLRFDQPKAAELDVLAVVYGYAAYTANRYANAWAKIGGTGLVTPTF
jgi:HK97 family phage major capsid protein